MNTAKARTPSLGVDTLATLTGAQCAALMAAGATFRGGYIEHVSPAELAAQLDAGLPFMPITYANDFDPAATNYHLTRLALPVGCMVWLDVEGVTLSCSDLIHAIDGWAASVQQSGRIAGLYVGAQSLLTSSELTKLLVTRYWHGCSRVVDRFNQPSEPARGWCVVQLRPGNTMLAGVLVDVDAAQEDYEGDVPVFAVG